MNKHATLNRFYRLVWNDSLGAYVVAAENVRGKGKRAVTSLCAALLTTVATSGFAAPPNPPAPTQLPTGPRVAAGAATVVQSGARMDVIQTTNRAAINWNTFNIGSQAQVNFNQPSSAAVALNRVLDSNPSQILGKLTANGQVYLVNPNGVYFGKSASVDVGGLLATTHSIKDADFMAGNMKFSRDGASGSIVNEGEIRAALGGYIALLAPEVRNEGVIVAQLGTVALASGESFSLNFDGNNSLAGIVAEPAAIKALVENKHAIVADGGLVILSARAVDALQGGVVRNSGSIEASSLTSVGGVVKLIGNDITLAAGSSINVSGASGGGSVLVGGDTSRAQKVSMEAGASIDASATTSGNGGTVTLVANLANPGSRTEVNGSISARGGNLGGDGGFVETSAAHVVFGGAANIDSHAPKGKAGNWLIDPVDFTIAATGGDISGSALGTLLASNSVTIQTATGTNSATNLFGTAGSNGDIFVNDTVGWAANTLTLSASRNIAINSVMSGSGTAKLALQYGQGAVASGNTATYAVNGNAKVNLPDGANFSTKLGSDGAVNNFTVISTMTPFASMFNSTGKFALGADIDAAAASVGKTGGWVPQNAAGYILDGLGHTISNLTITPSYAYQGLIGYNYGTIQNLGISNLVINASTNQSLGLVGYNTSSGVISGIKVSGTSAVACSNYCGTIIGWNDGGTLTNFSLTGNISVDAYQGGGAVGWNGTNGVVSNGTSDAAVSSPKSIYGVALGGIAGQNAGTISSVTNSGSVTLSANRSGSGVDTRFGNGVGGIIGENGNGTGATQTAGTLSGSTFSGQVTVGANAYYVGGLIGYNHATIDSSTNSGSVTVGNGSQYIGGLAGANHNAYGNGSLQVSFIQNNSTFSGSLNVGTSSLYIGGITGAMFSSSALASVTSSGTVTGGTGTTYVGGLVGYAGASASAVSISNSTSDATVTVGTAHPAANTGTSPVYMGFLIGNGTPTLTGTSFTGVLPAMPITVSISPLTLNYGATPTYTYSLVSGTLNGADTLASILTGAPACNICVTPGTYSVTQGTVASSSGSYALTWQNGSETVNKAPLTVTAIAASKTYNGVAYSGGNGVNYSGFVYSQDASVLGGTLSYGGSAQGAVNAGSYTITPSGLTSSNYNLSFTNGTLTVNKAPLTITTSNVSKTYDGTTAAAGTAQITAGTLYQNASNGNVQDSISGGTFAFSDKNAGAGNKTVTVAGVALADGNSGNNYQITYANNMTSTITPKALTATVTAPDKTYDGTTSATPTLSISGGLVSGETVTASGTATFNSKDVATANLVTVNSATLVDGSNGLASNYSLASGETVTAHITAKPLTVTGLTVSKQYDGAVAATLSGTPALQAAQAAGSGSATDGKPYSDGAGLSLAWGPTFGGTYADANAATGKTVALSGISLSGSNNYTLSPNTTGTITKAPLTITTSNVSKTYDATTAAAGTAQVTGTLYNNASNGNVLDSISGGTFTFTNANAGAGNKTVMISGVAVADGNSGNNYQITYANNTTSTITAKALTLTGLTVSKQYDGTVTASPSGTPALQATEAAGSGSTTDGKPYNDGLSLNLMWGPISGTYADANAGTGKAVTLSNIFLSGSSNYTLSPNIAGAITKAPLTVTTSNVSKTYDATTAAAGTAQVTSGTLYQNASNGNVQDSISGGTFAYSDKNAGAGNKTVTVAGVALVDGNSGNNYQITYANNTTSTITPKALTATVTAPDKTYDGTTSATPTLSISGGLVSGETVTASGTATFNSKDVATANLVTVNSATLVDGSNGLASNYSLASGETVTAHITAKPLTVTGLTVSKQYDGTVAATLSGTPALQAAQAAGSGSTTDGKPYSDGAGLGLAWGPTFGGTYADANAATGKTVALNGISLSGSNNYTLSPNTTGTITKAPLTITTSNVSKTYDATTAAVGTAQVTSGTLYQNASNGNVQDSISGGTFAYSDKNAGAGNKTVTVAGVALADGNSGNNYQITYANNTTSTITAKALTLTGLTVSKQYDGTVTASVSGTPALQATEAAGSGSTTDGKPYSDGLALALMWGPTFGGTYANANAATGKTVTLSGISLSGSNNYTLSPSTTGTITKAPLTITTTNASKTYDATTAVAGTAQVTSGTLYQNASNGNVQDSISGGTFAYTDKNAGEGNKVVTVAGVTVADGNSGGNYQITYANNTTSTITPKTLILTGLTATKRYDGTVTASLGGTPALLAAEAAGSGSTTDGKPYSDGLALALLRDPTFGGTYADANAAAGKTVALSGISLSGSSNYTLLPSIAGDISSALLTITTPNVSKTYDGTTAAAGTTQIISGTLYRNASNGNVQDSISGGTFAFSDKNAGAGNKAVTVADVAVADGNSGNNYQIIYANNTTSTITPKTLSAIVTAPDKTYDGNISATPTLSIVAGLVGAETVTATGTASFNSKDVVTANLVTVNSTALGNGANGGLASNYSLVSGETVTAHITPKALTANVAAPDKTYDGNTSATPTLSIVAGLVGLETVTATATASFNSKDVATAKLVTVNSIALGNGANGGLASNYSLASGQAVAARIIDASGSSSGSTSSSGGSTSSGSSSGSSSSGGGTSSGGSTSSGAATSSGGSSTSSGSSSGSSSSGSGSTSSGGTSSSGAATSSGGGSTSSGSSSGSSSSGSGSTSSGGTSSSGAATSSGGGSTSSGSSSGSSSSGSGSTSSGGSSSSGAATSSSGGSSSSGSSSGSTSSGGSSKSPIVPPPPASPPPALPPVTPVPSSGSSGGSSSSGSGGTTSSGSSSGSSGGSTSSSGSTSSGGGSTSSGSGSSGGSSSGTTETPGSSGSTSSSGGASSSGGSTSSSSGNSSGGGISSDGSSSGGSTSSGGDTSSGGGSSGGGGSGSSSGGPSGGLPPAPASSGSSGGSTSSGGTSSGGGTGGGGSSSSGSSGAGRDKDLVGGSSGGGAATGGTSSGSDSTSSGGGTTSSGGTSGGAAKMTGVGSDSASSGGASGFGGSGTTSPGGSGASTSSSGGASGSSGGRSSGGAASSALTAPMSGRGGASSGGDASSDGGVSGSGRGGVSVSLVTSPTQVRTGLVAVSVPSGTASSGEGFSFPLPAQVNNAAAGNNATIRVTTVSGEALPAWLKFLPETRTFVSAAVPDGAFPMQVVVTIAGNRSIIVISERTQ